MQNCFAISPDFARWAPEATARLVIYEKLMSGSQLVNKLRDLNYRVQTAGNPAALQQNARAESPMLLVVDLAGGDAVCRAIAR